MLTVVVVFPSILPLPLALPSYSLALQPSPHHLTQTSFGGRNRKCAEAFVKTGKTFDELEEELLNGQRLQGVITSGTLASIPSYTPGIMR